MNEQLFDVAPKLTERQNYVYELTSRFNGVDAAHAGAELHRRQRCAYCKPGEPCKYAESNGREVLEALRKKGLLKRDQHHVYRRVDGDTNATPADGYDPATEEIPF